jgi:hypothetical protein
MRNLWHNFQFLDGGQNVVSYLSFNISSTISLKMQRLLHSYFAGNQMQSDLNIFDMSRAYFVEFDDNNTMQTMM